MAATKRKNADPSNGGPSKKRTKGSKPSKDASSGASNGSKSSKKASALDKTAFTDPPDRNRELQVYEMLGREDETDRLNAADAIINGLLGAAAIEDAEKAQLVLERHLEKRLFRGLASGRNAARLGFSLVLTEVLRQLFGDKNLAEKFPKLTFDKVLGFLVEQTQAGGNLPGQEERDRYFGQLFGIDCFVQSGVLFSDKRRWLSVLDMLLALGQKKSWLKAQCGYVIAQAIPNMKKKLVEKTLEKLTEEGYAKTPEGVGIWIAALNQCPDIKEKHPLATSSLQALPPILKDSGKESNEPSKLKQGGWSAQLHFVWDLILDYFVKLVGKDVSNVDQFKQFWKRVVDDGFFAKTCSESQKFSGFMIFQKMFEGAVDIAEMVKALFSHNLMACLMNQAANEDRYLHRAAVKTLKTIEAVVGTHPNILPTVLRQLLREGAYNFDDRIGKTKTIQTLLRHTTSATIDAILKVLQSKPKELEDDKYYLALGSYLSRLTSAPESDTETERAVTSAAIKTLTALTYSSKSVSEKTREALRVKCTAAFAKLLRKPQGFSDLCGAVIDIFDDERVGGDDELSVAMSQAYERLRELLDETKRTDVNRRQRQALALLYAVGILQFYNEEPDALEVFDELEECYKKTTSRAAAAADDDGGDFSEFLVEILLAMVARPSSLMRQVSKEVFEAFTDQMSSGALELLTGPLGHEENEKGKQALFSTEDEDMVDADAAEEDDHDHDHDEELDSDVEIVDLADVGSDGGDGDEASDSSSDEDEDEDEAEDPNQEALDALDTALSEVLGSHRLDKDAEAESEEDSDMSDSEMMAVDEKLAEIFKHRMKTTNKKKARKDAKETVVNFKHRLLDLLSVYIKKEAVLVNPLAFEVLIPLLRLARQTTVKALSDKAQNLIQDFSKAVKKGRADPGWGEGLDADTLLALLREIHSEASRHPQQAQAFTKAVSMASLAVVGAFWDLTPSSRDEIYDIYRDTQKSVVSGAKIRQSFFYDWTNWVHSIGENATTK
ncbi:hypothetical protein OQA88_1697 [Cercophora sp. LCS_1]